MFFWAPFGPLRVAGLIPIVSGVANMRCRVEPLLERVATFVNCRRFETKTAAIESPEVVSLLLVRCIHLAN
jgi:hypothetical protein